MSYYRLLILLPIFIVFLSGCIGQSTTVQQTVEGVVTKSGAKEFKMTIDHSGGYSPSKIAVSKGDTVRILAVSNRKKYCNYPQH